MATTAPTGWSAAAKWPSRRPQGVATNVRGQRSAGLGYGARMDPALRRRLVTSVDQLTPEGSTTARFEGADHDSGVSFYVSRDGPGDGPDLHTHPYTETFVIQHGAVRFTVGEEVVDVGPGDVLVVPPDTPHGFTNVGGEPMHSVNVHAAVRMVQSDLPSRRHEDGSWVRID